MPAGGKPASAVLDDVASTGIPELDEALGGLFWGDNVVLEVPGRPVAESFYRAVASAPGQYDQRLYIGLSGEPGAFPGFELIDARPRGELAGPAPLIRAIVERCRRGARNLLLFEGMETMIDRWGGEVAGRFFGHCCPQLLELGAIAYWSVPSGEANRRLRRTIEEITQCVLVVEDSRLRIAKADGRPPGIEGSVFRYADADGLPSLTPAPIVARIGAALRAARTQRQLSQSGLARAPARSRTATSRCRCSTTRRRDCARISSVCPRDRAGPRIWPTRGPSSSRSRAGSCRWSSPPAARSCGVVRPSWSRRRP